MNNQDPSDEWTVFGNTLYLGPQGAAYIAFPGDAGTAQQLAAAHNQAIATWRQRLERDEAQAALLRGTINSARTLLQNRPVKTSFDDDVIRMLDHTLAERDAGAALLLQAIRAEGVAAAATAALYELEHDRTIYQHTRNLLAAALAAYEAGKGT